MISRTVEVDTTVSVEIELSEIPAEDLQHELDRREVAVSGGAYEHVLRRIVREHHVLGMPLKDVVDDLLREGGFLALASEAFATEE